MGQKHRLNQSFIVAVMSVFLLIAVYLTAVVLLPMAGKKEEQESPDDSQHLSDDAGNGELVTMNIDFSKRLVIVDAGHGGADPGKVSAEGILEKDINLAIALKLKEKLEDTGINVMLTRTGDDSLNEVDDKNKKRADLERRCDIINNSDADLVVCVHQNSYPSPKVSGAQMFFYKKSEESRALANCMQKVLCEQLGTTRQIKSDVSYYMLLNSNITTVIAECGFLSNPEEAALLNSEEYQEKVAKALFIGIVEYLESL